jgi:chemotaxis protein MotB
VNEEIRVAATDDPEADSYLASLSDLMVGMLFIFILMLMAFALDFRSATEASEKTNSELKVAEARTRLERDEAVNRQKELGERIEHNKKFVAGLEARLQENERLRRKMLEDMRELLEKRNVRAEIDLAGGVLRLPDDVLTFQSGSARLGPKGVDTANNVADVLADVLPCFAATTVPRNCRADSKTILEAVFIEGHTDSEPMVPGGRYENNWALSAARAVSTFDLMRGHREALGRLPNPSGKPLIGVSGYGEQRPIADNQHDEGRRRNRRIDLRFLLLGPSERDLTSLREELDRQLRDAGRR